VPTFTSFDEGALPVPSAELRRRVVQTRTHGAFDFTVAKLCAGFSTKKGHDSPVRTLMTVAIASHAVIYGVVAADSPESVIRGMQAGGTLALRVTAGVAAGNEKPDIQSH
jgi:hypothetical protein